MATHHKLIFAACQRLAIERPTFSLEDVVLAAWRAAPDVFGLRGYPDTYPDAHRVYAAMCGKTGMVERGYLVRVEANTYQLGRIPDNRITPRHPDEIFLTTRLGTMAAQRYNAGNRHLISYVEACRFFGPCETPADVPGTMERLRKIEMRDEDMRNLRIVKHIAEWLRERFARQWDQVKERKGA